MKLRQLTLTIIPFVFATAMLTQCKKAADGSVKTAISAAGEVALAKSAFTSLVRGEANAAFHFDWNTLEVLGKNIGSEYVQISSEVEKETYRTAFISEFSASYRKSGATVDAVTNWRAVHKDDLKTEVAADSPGGVISMIVIKKDGADKVASITIVK